MPCDGDAVNADVTPEEDGGCTRRAATIEQPVNFAAVQSQNSSSFSKQTTAHELKKKKKETEQWNM